MNPDSEVNVWVDDKNLNGIMSQLDGEKVKVFSVDTLPLSEKIAELVSLFSAPSLLFRGRISIPNYAAVSDIYRFVMLKIYGGAYFDTDITPCDISKIVLHPQLKFLINAWRENNTVRE